MKLQTNAPEEKSGLFAHFFRRLPKGIYLKNNILQWQSSKKIERLILGLSRKLVLNFDDWAFWICFLRKMKSFFSNEKIKHKSFFFQMKKIKNSFIFVTKRK